MTAPDHLRITGPEDILGFIPHSLGYWPEHSLVAMTLQGKRLGATLRVDLPVLGGGGGASTARGRSRGGAKRRSGSGGKDARPASPGTSCPTLKQTTQPTARCWPSSPAPARARPPAAELARARPPAAARPLAPALTRARPLAVTRAPASTRASALALPPAATTTPRWADLLAELEIALEAAGMPLRDAWIVGTEFWRNAYCIDPECCGPAGRPVEEIRNSRLNAEMVFRGSSVGAAPGADGPDTATACGPRNSCGRVRLGGAIFRPGDGTGHSSRRYSTCGRWS